MGNVDRYIEAATRENTRRSYQSAIRHFEVEWGGFLPASADAVARYLADHAESLSVNTLRARLAALAKWHQAQGFPDPTKMPYVRKVLKGIAALHPATEKRARPLQLAQLERLAAWLDGQITEAEENGDARMRFTQLRNRALVLLGFWRGFRSDELSRLRIEHISIEPARGMTLFLPRTKGDRAQLGTTFKAPALSRLCPVAAYEAWIAASGLTEGPVFRGIDRWGNLGEGLHAGSFVPLLRALFRAAGVPTPDNYSSHSLRRGFATWANSSGWDLKMLMEYVGWKDVRSAMRYIDAADPFAQHRIESALASTSAPSLPASAAPTRTTTALAVSAEASPKAETRLTLQLVIERNSKFVRGMAKARRWIEDFCLSGYAMHCLNRQRTRYELVMPFAHGSELEAAIEDLLGEIHSTADLCNCMAEAVLHDPLTDTYWH
ncbi:site-specific integrase (plasmid) [Burkholderia thailandensis]|uniref:site-specific integrase n=1 Tax=Burkholderia thailandensis TaxID=57975 RepID=UPI00192DDC7C|nr:site-specific integrase [Burkholderia thailandensis]MBS2132234.1 site-specific integrase [Burkholderia thailandensis]QRA15328.1 site-specific integrase [Burkholderia thailandensis]